MTRDAKKKRTKGLHAARKIREHVAGEPWSSIPRVNRKRKAKRAKAGEVYGPGYVWMTNQPCDEASNPDHVCIYYYGRNREAHHLKHVGSGGKDAYNLIPTCHSLHDEFHDKPLSEMEARSGKDYHAIAHANWCAWLDSIGGIAE